MSAVLAQRSGVICKVCGRDPAELLRDGVREGEPCDNCLRIGRALFPKAIARDSELLHQVIQREGEDDLADALERLGSKLRAAKPHLLNLVGCACLAPAVWPHTLPMLGMACFVAAAVTSLRRSMR